MVIRSDFLAEYFDGAIGVNSDFHMPTFDFGDSDYSRPVDDD